MPPAGVRPGFSGPQIAQFGKIAHALYKLYLERDASLVEVNPLIVTESGDLLALDAKINIEDNALFRHKDLAACAMPRRKIRWSARPRARAQLRVARRQYRLHGQWRRPCHGDHGSDPAARRQAGEFSGRGRRRHQGARSAAFKLILSNPR
jgi:hypothetical protein